MKSTKDFRSNDSSESMRRAAKLEPLRKSGKDRNSIYQHVNGHHDDDDEDYIPTKRESVFDYMDDQDED